MIHLKKLSPHQSNWQASPNILASAIITEQELKIMFQIHNYQSPKIPTQVSDLAYKNWGLWDFDVVEFFFRPIGSSDYFEIQTSFNNKNFQLQIFRPRELYFTPFDFKFSSHVEFKNGYWELEMIIPNKWKTTKFEGNLFSILSHENKRLYFALNPNLDNRPDFHRPELFMEL